MHKDVVCGIQVDEETTTYSSRYNGERFYFCSSACRTKFDLRPEAYWKSGERIHHHETAVYLPRPPGLKPR